MIQASTIGLDARLSRKMIKPVYPEPTRREVAVINEATEIANSETSLVPGSARYASEEVNGARALDMVERALNHYMRFEMPEYARIIAVWVAHTFFVDDDGRLMLPFSPRLFFVAEPGSGKTRMMEMLADLVYQAIGPVSGVVTAPGIRNAMEKHKTPLLDEVHRYIRKYDIQGYANGYTPKTQSLNGIDGVNGQVTYGPMALAGIKSKLFDSRLYDVIFDLFERCFVIELKKHNVKTDPVPRLDKTFQDGAEFARKVLGYWGAQWRPDDPEEKLWPLYDLPDELQGRAGDLATALCAVADRAVDIRETDDDGQPMTDERKYRWANLLRKDCVAVLTDAAKIDEMNKGMEDFLVKFGA